MSKTEAESASSHYKARLRKFQKTTYKVAIKDNEKEKAKSPNITETVL